MKTFKEENNDFLKFLLNERFFKNWKKPSNNGKDLHSISQIEFYITNQCNQHCEYCYLYNNYNIYPKEATEAKTILSNLTMIFNWLIENNYYIQTIDYFSGEIWHTQLGLDILDLTFKALQNGLQVKRIMIPTNGSFIMNDAVKQKIQNYINAFQDLGTSLQLSFSIDGKVIDNLNRPRNNSSKLYTDEFYNKVFDFAYHNDFFFHPMVAAYSIEKWKENFYWWKEMCQKYNWSTHYRVMMLEVRNDDWTEEKIKTYCDFLTFLMDDFRKENPQYASIENFSEFIFGKYITPEENYTYLPWVLALTSDVFSCTIPCQLCIRLGDLALAPCHRTAYDKFIYGYFQTQNGRIVDIKENNFYLAERFLYMSNIHATPHCDTCVYNKFCIKGCAGSQYENTGDLFFPIPSVCKLEKAKINTTINYYQKNGIIDYYKNLPIDHFMYSSASRLLGEIYAIQKESETYSISNS